jgi:hypothetical protein
MAAFTISNGSGSCGSGLVLIGAVAAAMARASKMATVCAWGETDGCAESPATAACGLAGESGLAESPTASAAPHAGHGRDRDALR